MYETARKRVACKAFNRILSMTRRAFITLAILYVLIRNGHLSAVAQESRLAVLIGSASSAESDIHASEDAFTFGETLRDLGYTIACVELSATESGDAALHTVRDATMQVANGSTKDTNVLVISLHGHGVVSQSDKGDPVPCFCPELNTIKGRASKVASVPHVPIARILELLSENSARAKILILDMTCIDQRMCLQFQSSVLQLLKSTKDINNTVILSNCISLKARAKVAETHFLQELKRAVQGSFEFYDGTTQSDGTVTLAEIQSYMRALAAQGNETFNWRSFQLVGHCNAEVSLSVPRRAPRAAGLEMLHIPAGRFRRGSRMYLCPTEQPVKAITLSRPFYVSKYELTIAQALEWLNDPEVVFDKEWITVDDAFCPIWQSNGTFVRNPKYESPATPVFDLTWNGAVAFCEWCSNHDREFLYRLPTEAEWEYVARAGGISEFPFGDSCNGTEANVDGSQPFGTVANGPHRSDVVEVGSFAPNAWGLFDTVGNVSEWCQDVYDIEFYKKSPTRDPVSERGIAMLRRGGSFLSPAIEARSSFRNAEVRHLLYHGDGLGVRIVAIRRSDLPAR